MTPSLSPLRAKARIALVIRDIRAFADSDSASCTPRGADGGALPSGFTLSRTADSRTVRERCNEAFQPPQKGPADGCSRRSRTIDPA